MDLESVEQVSSRGDGRRATTVADESRRRRF